MIVRWNEILAYPHDSQKFNKKDQIWGYPWRIDFKKTISFM